MKKFMKILGVVLVIAIVALAVMFLMPNNKEQLGNEIEGEEIQQDEQRNPNENTDEENKVATVDFKNIEKAEDLSAIIDQINAKQTMEMPMLGTQILDVTDADSVSYVTGLENGDDLEFAVESAPMMSSIAYSVVLVKVKDGVNAEEVAKKMCDNVDERKWICVTAEKILATNSGDVVCLVMSNNDTATAIYDTFKELAGTVGKEFSREAEVPEMPEDMY